MTTLSTFSTASLAPPASVPDDAAWTVTTATPGDATPSFFTSTTGTSQAASTASVVSSSGGLRRPQDCAPGCTARSDPSNPETLICICPSIPCDISDPDLIRMGYDLLKKEDGCLPLNVLMATENSEGSGQGVTVKKAAMYALMAASAAGAVVAAGV